MKIDAKIRLLELLREWRDSGKIESKDYVRAQRAVGAYNPRKGKTYKQIYGAERAQAIKKKARLHKKSLGLLEARTTLAILKSLYKKPRFIREIREEVGGSYSTIVMRVNALEKEGYLVTTYEAANTQRKVATLTQKGEEFARAYVGAIREPPVEI